MDGFYRANWKAAEDAEVATLTVDRFTLIAADPAGTPSAITAEGDRLLAFLAPGARERQVQFVPPP